MHCCQKIAFILPLLMSVACQDKEEKTKYRYIDAQGNVLDAPVDGGQLNCKADLQSACADIQSRIAAKQREVKSLSEGGDSSAWYLAQLDLNELLEIRDAYKKGNAEVTPIRDRYQALRQIVTASGGDPAAMGALSYQKDELEAVREVMDSYGELTIDPANVSDLPTDKPKTVVYSTQDTVTPWAAYWYPKRGRELFESPSSPLSKVDAWLNMQGLPSKIVEWESGNYDAAAAEWEGLCDAWAVAAISTIEPKEGKSVDNVFFTPSDLKAVAIKYFEGYKPKVYGRRYQGLAATDGLIQDLRPEAFHRLVEEFLGNRKQPIIVDEDPGPEIWSKPVFRVGFNISKDPNRPQALLVKAFPWMTRQRAAVTDDPTSLGDDLAAPTYEYRLYYDSTPTANGRLKIIAGEWLGSSLNFHPDMVFVAQSKGNQDQPNPEMKKYNADIQKLLEKAGVLQP